MEKKCIIDKIKTKKNYPRLPWINIRCLYDTIFIWLFFQTPVLTFVLKRVMFMYWNYKHSERRSCAILSLRLLLITSFLYPHAMKFNKTKAFVCFESSGSYGKWESKEWPTYLREEGKETKINYHRSMYIWIS